MFDDEKISSGDLRYICARNQHQAYNTLIREMKKSGLKQIQLAQRLGKGEDQISRLLKRPQNLTLDTYSELIYGICGAALKFSTGYPRTGSSTVRDTGTLVGADQTHSAVPKAYDFSDYGQQQWRKKMTETDSETKPNSNVEARFEDVAI